ncbi:MotA/TolQ/ExbB proton channel family protein [Solemya velum gill symbiont]|uniref:MotA/TolQ/ExbB proton channel family protein n=1 Tax=Solemya velum gill symbiont TaxID=2340 RepID=UPI000996CFF0|nr:MotA/TolQ/ExbB proton channel family protein [Solemya velum gill symbiont]OOZ45731.1 biopolymer transporter ExbB [Solemya velum gill symbiont]OOZ46989.1 biopolymer transporter ExbB [Solemya velum gill symbiont]OOZ48457.1 biopolymer transporter ExbB [Solemya velum gill symbiont]OOZ52088.1 biopolymer transporter ExbB [Solemya velum gill symbiont]OOZ54779.1 biopolymer transporter ExbB [Solemya velum gill symbiont]
MIELIQAGGWLMAPILLCSIIAMAIVIERFVRLRKKRINPPGALQAVFRQYKTGNLSPEYIETLQKGKPLERVFAAGLSNRNQSRGVMKESIEEVGRQVIHELERYLGILATIAAITPLLGLLGTVIGMIDVFTVIVDAGIGNPGILAGGISKALITTATGLSVAIPSILFHRVLVARVDELALGMEDEAVKLVDILHRSNT